MRQSEKEKCSKAEEKNSLEVGGEKQRQRRINTHGDRKRAWRERVTSAYRMSLRGPQFHLS